MPERWERELRRIRSVEPSEGLWERAAAGPAHPRIPPGPDRRSRLVATVVSLVVVLAAGFGLWNAFGHARTLGPVGGSPKTSAGPSTGPGSTPGMYFVALPDGVTAHTVNNGTQLVVTVRVTTNMPDRTRALVWYTFRGGTENGGGGGTASATVKDGGLDVEVPWGVCDFGEGFSLRVEFRPFYEDFIVPGYPPGLPWPPTQPAMVLGLLGTHFERLTGEQVTTVDSSKGPIRQIAVARTYAWPETPADFIPPPCPSPGSP